MTEFKMNSDYKPKCPKCEGLRFAAVNYEYLQNSEKTIALIVCADDSCQTVVGALPYSAVWAE